MLCWQDFHKVLDSWHGPMLLLLLVLLLHLRLACTVQSSPVQTPVLKFITFAQYFITLVVLLDDIALRNEAYMRGYSLQALGWARHGV
jgi:hypothetical protein